MTHHATIFFPFFCWLSKITYIQQNVSFLFPNYLWSNTNMFLQYYQHPGTKHRVNPKYSTTNVATYSLYSCVNVTLGLPVICNHMPNMLLHVLIMFKEKYYNQSMFNFIYCVPTSMNLMFICNCHHHTFLFSPAKLSVSGKQKIIII